ncbi:MAG: hypothetical protein WA738_20180 [Candidatus Angelobacter sp.]
MIRDLKCLCILRRILLCSILVSLFASVVPVYALPALFFPAPLQAGRGQNPNGDAEAQRTQQYDQNQRLQEQEQQNQAVRHPGDDLGQLQPKIWQLDAERIRLKELLRENFRRHYAIVRRNAEELVQLSSNLQANIESNNSPALARDMMAKAGTMQKLAHEIRESMAGHSLPKVKPSPRLANASGMVPASGADHRELLLAKTNTAKTTASALQSSVEGYLASDNEQTVSVSALQRGTDKNRFDPNSLAILSNSLKLEQLAREIRSEIHTLNTLH